MEHWESDDLVVAEKGVKSTWSQGGHADQFMIVNFGTVVMAGIIKSDYDKIASFAEEHPGMRIRSLSQKINRRNLTDIHNKMDRKKAKGIDNVSKDEYSENLEENILKLVNKLIRDEYTPQASRRVFIPKLNGKKRPLGIPCYEDKLVEVCIAKLLSAVYESRFINFSYGFRPCRSCHQAVGDVRKKITTGKIGWVVEADIKGFFDSVDHDLLIKFLEKDIEDRKFIRLIRKFLKAGIMHEGKFLVTDVGTPQGNAMSPMLANVYLHYVLDSWFEEDVKRYCRGEAHMIRYADDFVCLFQHKRDAERFLTALNKRMNKFKLELEPTKTKILEFGRFAEVNRKNRGEGKPETFNFLGFTFYCAKSYNKKFMVKVLTERKKFSDKLKKLSKWLYDHRTMNVVEIIKRVNLSLAGHYNYYGVTSNSRSIRNFYHRATNIKMKSIG